MQRIHLTRRFPDASCVVRRGELRWHGLIRPTPLSRTYTVLVTYKKGKRPKIRVLKPRLKSRGGKRPPHVYGAGDLCLYYPRSMEWDATMLLATTIIPWTSEWLVFYELWQGTGEWFGGGLHPN